MTRNQQYPDASFIIPYQELLGNYDPRMPSLRTLLIIPYQELLGNYDVARFQCEGGRIIPYQELLGNYDHNHIIPVEGVYYTIPRAIREL